MTRRGLVWALAVMLGAASAQAQKTEEIAKLETVAGIATPRSIKDLDVFLVTMAEPTRRQKCRVLIDDEQKIECSRHFGRKPLIYQRSGLLAVLRPAMHDHSGLWALIPLSAGGGIIWGAVALSSITVVGAIPVALIGSVVVLVAGVCAALGNQEGQPEVVLYLRPGEALPFSLRN